MCSGFEAIFLENNGKKKYNFWFVAYSNYLVKYAKFVKAVNEDLLSRENFNAVSDIKFSMIDLYSRIVVDAFSKLTKDVDLAVIGNKVNLDEIHNYFKFENSYIVCNKALSVDAIKFIENYNICNKELFADKFVETLNSATGIDANSTVEKKAAFYFNQLFYLPDRVKVINGKEGFHRPAHRREQGAGAGPLGTGSGRGSLAVGTGW